MTIYKDGKTIIRGRYAVSTFNYKTRSLVLVSINPVIFDYRDYIYGIYTYLNRDDPSVEYYYCGYFVASTSPAEGTYRGCPFLNAPFNVINNFWLFLNIVSKNLKLSIIL